MFTPENDLERSLVRAAEQPEHRAAFLKELLDAELAFALIDSGDAREGYVVPEVSNDDLSFVPVFTSESRIKAMFGDEKLQVVRQTFRQILEQIDDANFVLNPGSDYGRELMAEDVACMLDGDFERAAEGFEDDDQDGDGGEDEPPMMIGEPSPAPVHLTAPLAALFATIPEVKKAHIGQAVFADSEGVRRLVIGLTVEGDIDAVLDRVSGVLETAARPSDVIDFVEAPGSPLDEYFSRDLKPFYSRNDPQPA